MACNLHLTLLIEDITNSRVVNHLSESCGDEKEVKLLNYIDVRFTPLVYQNSAVFFKILKKDKEISSVKIQKRTSRKVLSIRYRTTITTFMSIPYSID